MKGTSLIAHLASNGITSVVLKQPRLCKPNREKPNSTLTSLLSFSDDRSPDEDFEHHFHIDLSVFEFGKTGCMF